MTASGVKLIKEADLYRFKFYASRIRMLQLTSFMENVSTHIYMAIAEAFQGKTLFPALTSVHIHSLNNISNGNFFWLHLITPSPLSTVEICRVTKSNGTRLASFIDDMSRLHRPSAINSHPLSTLSLEGIFLPSTTTLLQKLAFQLTVAETNIFKEVLKVSSSLLSLLEFDLHLPNDELWDLRTDLFSQKSKLYTFPTLQDLYVAGPSSHVNDVFRSIYGVHLSTIAFTILPPAPNPKLEIPECI